MAKNNEAKIKFTAETGEFNDAIKKSNNEMAELRAEMKLNETQMKGTGTTVEGLEQKHKILQKQLDASKDKTEAFRKKVDKATEIYGENSEEVSKLKIQLLNARNAEEKLKQAVSSCEREIEDHADATEDAAGSAKKFGNSLDDAKDSAKGAGDGFTIMGGTVADLASNAIQSAISMISEFVGWLGELPEATREFRQNMSTLTTSFDKTGFSSETAIEVWKELYSVFGDDATAVEASNHIARLSNSQEELSKWTNIVTGLYGEYQDAINPAAIMESAKETAVCGQVTGAFADALNWSSEAMNMFAGYMNEDVATAEDAFNVALSACTSEQERQALITDTLTKLYGGAADTYREVAGAQLEAKEASAEHMLAESDLATAVEPITTAYTQLKTELLTGAKPAIEAVSGIMVDALGWMKEHPVVIKVIAATVATLAAALVALGTYVMLVFFGGIIAAITAVIAVITLVIEYWNEIVEAVTNAVDTIKSVLGQWAEWMNTNVIQPVVNFFTNLWLSIQNVWNQICNVIQVAFMFIASIVQGAFDLITLPFRFIWENCKQYVFDAFEWIKTQISTAMNAIKSVFSRTWSAIVDVISPITERIRSIVTTVWTSIKTATSTAFNAVKNTVSNIWNGIKNTVSNVVNGIKNTVSNVFNGIKSVATSVWNGVKNAITKPIEAAKNKIKSIIDTIKGFFDKLKLKFPKIKMPHFSIKGKFSLDPPSVPKLAIDWHADGGIFTRPTLIGSGNRVHGVGEAGAEAILPIDKLEGYVAGAIEKTMQVVDLNVLASKIEDLANRPINLWVGDRQIAVATASASDNVNGLRSTFKNRGLALE